MPYLLKRATLACRMYICTHYCPHYRVRYNTCIKIHSTQTFRCFVLVDILNFSHSRLPRFEALLNALILCLVETLLYVATPLFLYSAVGLLIANLTSPQGRTFFRIPSQDYKLSLWVTHCACKITLFF